MLVDLYKNNVSTSKNYGMYYPRIFKRGGLNLKGFAKHIISHGSSLKYATIVQVLQESVECIKEMMTQGVPVKLDGLGTFSPGIKGTGANSIDEFNVSENIKGIRINFRPESSGDPEDQLTKTALLDQTSFEMNDYVESFTKTIGGKKKRYQVRHPLASYGIANAEADPEEGD